MSAILSEPQITFDVRLRAVRHRLLLIKAASAVDEMALAEDPAELLQAVYMATQEALELLEPVHEHLNDLPGGMVNWKAPEDDAKGRTR